MNRLLLLSFILIATLVSSAFSTEIIQTLAGGGSVAGYKPDETNLALNTSQGIAISPIGEIYFADANHHQILKIEPTFGTITIIAGNGTKAYNGDGFPATSAGLDTPGGIAFDTAGNLYFCDRGNFAIRRIDVLSSIITTVAGVGSSTNNNPLVPLGDGGPALQASFSTLGDLVVDSSGAIIVCDTGNACIRKFTLGGTIATIAGSAGSASFAGDGAVGGATTTARFNSPTGIAIDPAGSIYIADSGNRRVRKLTSAATVTTVVGTGSGGTTGFNGDGGPAISAQIGSLGGLQFDSTNNLLITCVGANRIRKFVNDVSGNILTIAGNGSNNFSGDLGPATGAAMSNPRDIAIDSTGNIFILDVGNRRLRRVDQATGFIDTIAGTGLNGFIGDRGPYQHAVLAAPSGTAFDAAGNMYIADRSDNAVRRITPAGIVTTFAGDGSANGLGDGGLAILASLNGPADICVFGTTLYIADTGNDLIRAVNLATNIITTYAQVNAPVCVVAAPSGVLYVAHDDEVETVDLNKAVTPFAGSNPVDTANNPLGDGLGASKASLFAPSGLALNAIGELFIADTGNNLIRKIGVPPGLIVSTIAGQGSNVPPDFGDGGPADQSNLDTPLGVAVDATRIYIADSNNQRIRAINIGTNIITSIAGTGVAGCSGDGDLAVNAQVNFPGRMILNGTNLVFADPSNNRIRQIVQAIDINPALLSFSAKLNFAINKTTGDLVTNGDSVAIKAALALPAGINAANLPLRVDVVDLHVRTQLSVLGKFVKPVKTVVVPPTDVFGFTPETPPSGPLSSFSLGLKGISLAGAKPVTFAFACKGTLREEIGRAGFSNITTPTTPPLTTVPVRVNISVGTTTFTGMVNTLYKATQFKSGAATTIKPQ